MQLPGTRDILLAVTHFPSKMYQSEASQTAECVELANSIRQAERQVGHSRTVLVGDLNMNPFEDGVVNTTGLHAVMSRNIAARTQRTVQARTYPFFYNPMWSRFGDARPGPPGTYYYNRAEHNTFFWNMFDQVLVRPGLLNSFRSEDVEIVQTDGSTSLLSSQGFPDVEHNSDHLPLLFRLQL